MPGSKRNPGKEPLSQKKYSASARGVAGAGNTGYANSADSVIYTIMYMMLNTYYTLNALVMHQAHMYRKRRMHLIHYNAYAIMRDRDTIADTAQVV